MTPIGLGASPDSWRDALALYRAYLGGDNEGFTAIVSHAPDHQGLAVAMAAIGLGLAVREDGEYVDGTGTFSEQFQAERHEILRAVQAEAAGAGDLP